MFQSLSGFFQLGNRFFKSQIFLTDQRFRRGNDRFRQPQPLANGKRVGLPGRTQNQPIGGAESFNVEFTGGVLHVRLLGGIQLQFLIVGSDHQLCPVVFQPLNDSLCQSRTLDGVCTGTQFVQQHQRVPVCLFQNLDDTSHVCRECGKVLLDALGIADVCQHIVENGNAAALCRRNQHAAHCH